MSPAPNFPELEKEILEFWQEKNIFHKTLKKESPRGNFIFYEGPPTANGRPGIHHVLARAFKDVIPRFKTMQGYHVPRKAGWDTHGLPVELQVEKQLGISGKPDIEEIGVGEFNKKCKESVWVYKDEWEKLTKRMAYWLDLEHPYITYSNDYIETLWWILKEIYQKGLLYLGHKVVPHCPRCGTALSSHEVAQGYQEIEEQSIYVKFPLKGEVNTYILSWTTTPWTLPGNVALAVGENINYSKVKAGKEYYILATELLEEVLGEGNYEIVDNMRGENLVGLKYSPIFPGALDAGGKKAWYVTAADFVTIDEGTGVVHTAVMYGEDDYLLGEKLDLPKVHTVDEDGKFKSSVKKWSGQFVKSKAVENGIIEDLKKRGLLLKEKMYKHDYPFCWRCDTPLLYYAKDSWFIKMSSLRKELIRENKKINWIPAYIKEGRFGEWIANAKDWAISRERFWGTPLPIWECAGKNCGEIKVIGSYGELVKESGIIIDENFDPHRPFIDEVKLKCDQCAGEMLRTKMVADCWFDSGSMPLAQHHYPFENKERLDQGDWYPADFISEAIDQTRGWFYTLLAIAVVLGRSAPYKNVICLAHINDKYGKKMSKSRGNIVDPWQIMKSYGADALRLHLYTINGPGDTKNFDEKNVADVLRKNFIVLWNVLSFYKMHAVKEETAVLDLEFSASNVLDQWILVKLNLFIKEVTEELKNYQVMEAGRQIMDFINELSTWYLRRSRERFKSEGEDKQAALFVLGGVLLELVKVMAPFTPLAAEALYQDLGGEKESVHLADWPRAEEQLIKVDVLAKMQRVRKIIELGLAAREKAGIKVRQPLQYLRYEGDKLSKDFESLIAEELNLKAVKWTKKIREQKGRIIKEDGGCKIGLHIEITDELQKEGYLRELTRQINALRKKLKLTIKDKIELYVETDSRLVAKTIKSNQEKLCRDTLSDRLVVSKGQVDGEKEVIIDGQKVWLGVKFINDR